MQNEVKISFILFIFVGFKWLRWRLPVPVPWHWCSTLGRWN